VCATRPAHLRLATALTTAARAAAALLVEQSAPMEAMQLRHALEMLLTVGEGTQISAVVHMLLQLAQLDGALWRRGLCSPRQEPELAPDLP